MRGCAPWVSLCGTALWALLVLCVCVGAGEVKVWGLHTRVQCRGSGGVRLVHLRWCGEVVVYVGLYTGVGCSGVQCVVHKCGVVAAHVWCGGGARSVWWL